jgi:hypothetical protein
MTETAHMTGAAPFTQAGEWDGLTAMIHDAEQVHLPRIPLPRTIDLTAPARHDLVIPAATVTMLEDYELYVS